MTIKGICSIKSIKVKIIFYTSICLIIFGLISNLFIYNYLNNIVLKKVEHIVQMDIDSVSDNISKNLSDMLDLTILCSSDINTMDVLYYKDTETPKAKRDSVTVQDTLTSYLKGSSISKYVLKLCVFNDSGLIIQAVTPYIGGIRDYPEIISSKLFQNVKLEGLENNIFTKVYPSITESHMPCLPIIYPIYDIGTLKINGYLYAEFDLRILTDTLSLYGDFNNLFLTTSSDEKILLNDALNLNPNVLIDQIRDDKSDNKLKTYNIQGTTYLVSETPLKVADYKLYSSVKLSDLYIEGKNIFFMMLVVLGTSIIIATITLVIISTSITSPIKKLISKIKKISKNGDFSYDPEIEASEGEIGEIGKVVNEMSANIKKLLEQTVEITNQKKNYEIAMLQSQVNPHFLYNTLNSIHWMATLQKNTGICNITNSLTNLLKNMAKGFSDKIPLEEEISLLEDYISIQSIRYMETFEFINNIDESFSRFKIVKLTLQPIVENAIFHGIEPKGTYGTITLAAEKFSDYIVISVTDNGVGMTSEKQESLLRSDKAEHKSSLNGIGIFNVDNRLKLIYGDTFGLTIESVKDEYTKVSVKIPIEESDDKNV